MIFYNLFFCSISLSFIRENEGSPFVVSQRTKVFRPEQITKKRREGKKEQTRKKNYLEYTGYKSIFAAGNF